MIRCRMVAGGFQHQNSVSINDKLPNNFIWVKDGGEYDISIHVDEGMRIGLGEPKKNKFGWVFECEEVMDITQWVMANLESVCNSYELIFTHNKKLLDLGRNFVFMPSGGFWINEPKMGEKNKLISMVSSSKSQTSGHKKRLSIMEKYREEVDLFGRNVNPIARKEESLENYMFSIVVENAKYDNFFTEKILDCFAMGTIPVYWGTDTIGTYFNTEGIIKLTEDFKVSSLSKSLYDSKLEAVKDNFQRVKEYEIIEYHIIEYLNKKNG